MKLKKFLKFRVLFLLFWIIISIIAINPSFNTNGVAIKGIEQNSTALSAGMIFDSSTTLTNLEKITAINGKEINDLDDYSKLINNINNSEVLRIQTNKKEYVMLKTDNLGIVVGEASSSNLRKGLDLQGGTRVVLESDTKLTDQETTDIIRTISSRLNVYGLSDIKIKQSKDLFGNSFIIAEVAGASKEEVKDLISSQGKFEAKIGGETVFTGGKKDITFVCRDDGVCSGVRQCNQAEDGGYQCRFEFAIKLSPEAAKKHAQITGELDTNISSGSLGGYLSKPLDLYLDDNLVDSLQISSNLKGLETTDISISGPGFGTTRNDAVKDANKNMNKLQTVLITGSLPVKLNIVKLDAVSPALGKAFANNAVMVILAAIVAVAIVIFIRYRDLKISIPVILISSSEILIILGIAALIKYNLDLAAIAGILAAVGTGVDDQIVIADEISSGKKEHVTSFKEKIKRAFFVIMVAWATGVASMIPLFWAGAGLFTGFALTTIIGICIGVFITRPAFASIVESLEES